MQYPHGENRHKADAGAKLADLNLTNKSIPHFGVKEAVFPFNMFPEVDPVLGPEMRSTGEVPGMAGTFGLAFYRAQEATQQRLPSEGTVLMTISDHDKPGILEAARQLHGLGFKIRATKGTQAFLEENGIPSLLVRKLDGERPNLVDVMSNGEFHLVINAPNGKVGAGNDSHIRKTAIKYRVPYITTAAAAIAAARGIAASRDGNHKIRSLQEYHADLK